jgi:hypothetical protein
MAKIAEITAGFPAFWALDWHGAAGFRMKTSPQKRKTNLVLTMESAVAIMSIQWLGA